MSTAFVTGANGFIGQRLVAALRARGDHVRQLLWRSKKTLALPERVDDPDAFVAPLEDVETLTKAMSGVDVVYHLAGRTAGYRREEFVETNVEGVRALLEARRRAESGPRRIVFVSSAMAAGPSGTAFPRSEAHRIEEGHTFYGDSKAEAEKILWEESQKGDLEVVIVRPPIVYGPGDEDVLQLLRAVRYGIVAQPGLRMGPISVVYVDDLVRGLIAAADHGKPLPLLVETHALAGVGAPVDQPVDDAEDARGQGIYYLTDGEVHTAMSLSEYGAKALERRAVPIRVPAFMVHAMAWVFEIVGRITGRVPTLTRDKARGAVQNWWCDDRRARAELEYRPRFGLGEGMRATVSWYRDRGRL